MSTRALLVCPGRGSYSRDTLGILQGRSPAVHDLIAACDAHRAERGQPTLTTLDTAERFSSAKHQHGEHASLLTFACSMADALELRDDLEVVGVTGNSMGWYTALAVAGALSLRDAMRLVNTMGTYQAEGILGGQLLTPVTGDDWQPDAARRHAVFAVLEAAQQAGHQAFLSIDLCSFLVLAGDDGGIAYMSEHLPSETRGSVTFPTRLPRHAAFHTPMMDATSARAMTDLADLRFQAPRVPLIDGAGRIYAPHWADPEAMVAYTLGEQVTDPYDYHLALRTALHHCAPDVVVLLGPGNSLGGPSAAALVQDGWRGLRTREALSAATPSPLASFARASQKDWLRGTAPNRT